jgi:hypothetical protein
MGLSWSSNQLQQNSGFYGLPEGVIKSRLPKRIILVRHGESIGNLDEGAYCHTPDSQISLTSRGREQAENLGHNLKKIVQDGIVVK